MSEAFLGGNMKTISETMHTIEKDVSLQRSVTMPLLLFKLCKKYNISVSEATQEGALMLLRMNDAFMDSEGSLEETYRNAPSKHKDKVQMFTALLNKIGGSQ